MKASFNAAKIEQVYIYIYVISIMVSGISGNYIEKLYGII